MEKNKLDNFIDDVGNKYGYDNELVEALKKCVPAMIDGKTEEEVNLLMQALQNVQIYTFNEKPSNEQIDSIVKLKENGRNKHVKEIKHSKGEYDSNEAEGEYINIPIFDEQMNIVDVEEIICLTNLSSYSQTAKFYGTNINLSHLIHELGHAWAAQREMIEQQENGDFVSSMGTSKFYYKVDRVNHTVEDGGVTGLFLEETLNTQEESETLCKIFNIKSFEEIPGYIKSLYQGNMLFIMNFFKDKIGNEPLRNLRILKDRSTVEELDEAFKETQSAKRLKEPEYYSNKEKEINRVQEANISEDNKEKLMELYERNKEVFFAPSRTEGLFQHLDRVLEQLYGFEKKMYCYEIEKDEKNMEIFNTTSQSILCEGTIPINQVAQILERKKSRGKVSIKELTQGALEVGISSEDVDRVEKEHTGTLQVNRIGNVKVPEA